MKDLDIRNCSKTEILALNPETKDEYLSVLNQLALMEDLVANFYKNDNLLGLRKRTVSEILSDIGECYDKFNKEFIDKF